MINFYSIYDKKVKMYNLPFAAPNDQSAVLAVRQSMLEDVARIKYLNKTAQDLELYCVGIFDQEKGWYLPSEAPTPIFVTKISDIVDFQGGSDNVD